MSEVIQANPDRAAIWKRGLFMLLFSVLYGVAEVVLSLLVFVQFVLVLISGSANQQLLRLGGSLARYTREVFEYLTFNTDRQPFPMSDWPDDDAQTSPWYEGREDAVQVEESQVQEEVQVQDGESDQSELQR